MSITHSILVRASGCCRRPPAPSPVSTRHTTSSRALFGGPSLLFSLRQSGCFHGLSIQPTFQRMQPSPGIWCSLGVALRHHGRSEEKLLSMLSRASSFASTLMQKKLFRTELFLFYFFFFFFSFVDELIYSKSQYCQLCSQRVCPDCHGSPFPFLS